MSYDELAILKKLKRTPRQVGWLDLTKKEIHLCSLFEHLEYIRKFSDRFPEEVGILQQMDDELNETYDEMEQELSYMDEGEHPEMHRYEMTIDDIRFKAEREITRMLKSKGLVRFSKTLKNLYVDVDEHNSFCDHVAEMLKLDFRSSYNRRFY